MVAKLRDEWICYIGRFPQWKSINKCWSIIRHVVVWILFSDFSIIRITSFGDRIQFRFIRVSFLHLFGARRREGYQRKFSFLSVFSFFFPSSFHFFYVCYSTHFQVFSPVFFVNFTSVWFVIN